MTAADLLALHGEDWSLVLEQREGAAPLWHHLGGRVEAGALPPLAELRAPATFALDDSPAMEVFPVPGAGWFGPPALAISDGEGRAVALGFTGSRVEHSKDGLELTLIDAVAQVEVELRFRHSGGALVIATTVRNIGSKPLGLDRCASAVVPLPADMARIVSWRGRHNAEFVEVAEAMPEHAWVRETRRGLTGHGGPCGAYVMAGEAGWHAGAVVALQLAWSGDARLTIERDDEGFWIAQAEAVLVPGEVVLAPGEAWQAPEVLLAISGEGRNGAMAQMHGAVRARLAWPGGAMRPRPVHANSWEAVYFAHDHDRILALARAAAAVGCERFVLDDGWFSGRDHDRAGLGDWTPDARKYPQGLAPLAEAVGALGMEFGLWVEPEMINSDSNLYRKHPDWVLAAPGRDRPTARHQLVLDLRREDVRDHLFVRLDAILRSAPIAYLKWDHNRDHAPGGGAAQMRGAYELFARVRAAHPQVEIEACAGGGGRCDAGIAEYVHRFWTSDNIDALSRVPIQRGFLHFLPPEVMGAHVGASPSHATGRSQRLGFRAAVALQGHFGIELDPEVLHEGERAELAEWIALARRWRHLIHGHRTLMGEGADGLVWQAQGDGDEWLLWVLRRDHPADRRSQPVRLPFASESDWNVKLLRAAIPKGVLTPRAAPAFHAMRAAARRFTGSWLADAGLPLPALAAESALLFHLQAVKRS